ncbi:N-acyl homoserine lactonase family protein [Lysobacter antibioticus]|uniref:N-acyl homoserine lactonase family protein n=1 Tax=Lysobacter antibioticus TaxID=84531 RepID=UPI0007E8E7C1|nr:N-acyl homoserine lactonase family protein [Lysobacter antibioticus]
MTSWLKRFSLALALGGAFSSAPAAAPAVPELRLYAIDCGRAQFDDLAPFADTGEYEGHPGTLMASCFLIRHPQGDLLWDAGLGDQHAGSPEGVRLPLFRAVVSKTVASQLQQLGLSFDDIDYFAFSHGHGDHLGNANRLQNATWIVNRKELEWLSATPAPARTNLKLIEAQKQAKTVLVDGDHDVFGDGSVRIFKAPGHSPGHQVLLVKLPRNGAVMLSGDLFHSHENRKHRRMPVFNVSRSDTLASIERIEGLLRHHRARLVIQHSTEDFAKLPALPAYLD